jgi:hypothetical protein
MQIFLVAQQRCRADEPYDAGDMETRYQQASHWTKEVRSEELRGKRPHDPKAQIVVLDVRVIPAAESRAKDP